MLGARLGSDAKAHSGDKYSSVCEFGFELKTPDRLWQLLAPTGKELQQWVSILATMLPGKVDAGLVTRADSLAKGVPPSSGGTDRGGGGGDGDDDGDDLSDSDGDGGDDDGGRPGSASNAGSGAGAGAGAGSSGAGGGGRPRSARRKGRGSSSAVASTTDAALRARLAELEQELTSSKAELAAAQDRARDLEATNRTLKERLEMRSIGMGVGAPGQLVK